MPVYLISYDLKKQGQNYNKLYDLLESTGVYSHILDSAWLVASSLSSAEILQSVKSVLDANDGVFITEVSGTACYLPEHPTLPPTLVDLLGGP